MTLKVRFYFLLNLLAAGFWFLTSCASINETVSAGAKGPVKVFDLEGRGLDLMNGSPARPAVFIFVRTDCPISNRYAPEVQRLASRFKSDGLQFFLVYPDPDEAPAAIRKHLQDFNYSLEALRDPQHALVKKAKAQVTPEAAVFSATGRLLYHGRIDNRYVDFGRDRPEATERDLENVLQAISEGKTSRFVSKPAIGCYITQP